MQTYLFLFGLLPLVIMAIVMLLPRHDEKNIARATILNGGLILLLSIVTSTTLITNGFHPFFTKHFTLYNSSEFDFSISYFFDKITMFFSIVAGFIFMMVAKFSQTYMHRDEGYKRYFVILNMFIFGFMITVISGNFETLFLGWEVLGVCSFLLISFYRDRYLPVKNALKVISFFRFGDVCLILALWACHHLFHQNISFNEIHSLLEAHGESGLLLFAVSMILVASLIKSAAFPFMSWLPRAMEGPTTSSAIFYGALSVHLGIFLLLRSYPLWSEILGFKILLIVMGLLTAFVASNIARVQSTVKTQIAYASVVQIGFMIIEIALGLHWLALIHFLCNASYRTYQFLISPSVMNYQIHDMFFHFRKKEVAAFSQLQQSLFLLNIKEWNLDIIHKKYLWQPFKKIGKSLNFISTKTALFIFISLLVAGILYTGVEHHVHPVLDNAITYVFALLGLMLVLKSFASRRSGLVVWLYLILGQAFVMLSVIVNEHVELHKIIIYMSGIALGGLIGLYALLQLKKIDNDLLLDKWHSFAQQDSNAALLLFIACLAILGFPFTPTFLGIDLLYTHLNSHQYLLLFIISLSFIFMEISALRLYARLCMGIPKANEGVTAWRYS
jgi:NADH-quinone oxidoreductase subunit L